MAACIKPLPHRADVYSVMELGRLTAGSTQNIDSLRRSVRQETTAKAKLRLLLLDQPPSSAKKGKCFLELDVEGKHRLSTWLVELRIDEFTNSKSWCHTHQTPVLQYIYLLKLCVQSGPLFWHPLFESDNGIIPIHEPCEP
jgi:hypothetical protein